MFQDIIDRVPQYSRFMTVKEMDDSTGLLAERYPEVVEVFEAGKSKKGHPIYCLKIGKGSKNALAYGCPHPNEPIGAMMLEYFSWYLAENREFREAMDYTWYIVKCSDPDGAMLNEGWFNGPFTISNYARNFFRPPSQLQVDWTFPIKYKGLDFNEPIPETRALMNIIAQAKPSFIYPLHNSGFGGAYWYMSRAISELNEELNRIPQKQGIPLDLGEPEAPYAVVFGPAIYKALSIKDEYDYMEKYGNEDPARLIRCGSSSGEYAGAFGDVFGLVCEVPYFYDPRINDTSESGSLRKDAALEACAWQEKVYGMMEAVLKETEGYVSEDNVFRIALKEVVQDALSGISVKRNWVESQEQFRRKATISEEFENRYVSKFYTLLSLGMLCRMIGEELEKAAGLAGSDGEITRVLTDAGMKAQKELSSLCEVLENGMNYTVIPIQKLVRVQLESGLVIARELNRR